MISAACKKHKGPACRYSDGSSDNRIWDFGSGKFYIPKLGNFNLELNFCVGIIKFLKPENQNFLTNPSLTITRGLISSSFANLG